MTRPGAVVEVDRRYEGWKAIADARRCSVRTAMRRYGDYVTRAEDGTVWVMRSTLDAVAAKRTRGPRAA